MLMNCSQRSVFVLFSFVEALHEHFAMVTLSCTLVQLCVCFRTTTLGIPYLKQMPLYKPSQGKRLVKFWKEAFHGMKMGTQCSINHPWLKVWRKVATTESPCSSWAPHASEFKDLGRAPCIVLHIPVLSHFCFISY